MINLAILLLLKFIGASAPSFAYIPEYGLLASHAADQHGKGAYLIEQEVSYRRESEALSVKETWVVDGEHNLRVTLEGRGPLKGLVQGTILFAGGQKYFFDPTLPSLRQQRLGDDWLEPLFYFRNAKFLRSRLVTLKVAPSESLHDRAALNSEGDPQYSAPDFLRLSRVGGAIAWAIGTPPLNPGPQPALWLEQDQFVLRKFRGVDQIILRANEYAKYDEGLWFPRQRLYTFGAYTVEVQTLQVRKLGKLNASDPRFRPASLNPARDAVKLPDAPALREFYSRFR